VWKREGSRSGSEINHFGSGSLRPNNFGSGRVRIRNTFVIISEVIVSAIGLDSNPLWHCSSVFYLFSFFRLPEPAWICKLQAAVGGAHCRCTGGSHDQVDTDNPSIIVNFVASGVSDPDLQWIRNFGGWIRIKICILFNIQSHLDFNHKKNLICRKMKKASLDPDGHVFRDPGSGISWYGFVVARLKR